VYIYTKCAIRVKTFLPIYQSKIICTINRYSSSDAQICDLTVKGYQGQKDYRNTLSPLSLLFGLLHRSCKILGHSLQYVQQIPLSGKLVLRLSLAQFHVPVFVTALFSEQIFVQDRILVYCVDLVSSVYQRQV
jgi:hypothetical protein